MAVCTCHRGQDLELRWFDDGAVVFDDATGDLTALHTEAARALAFCLDGIPRDLEALAAAVLPPPASDDDTERLRNWLRALERLGFVTWTD